MAKKKKSQPQSAIPFFLMAGFAFLAGFPLWLVLVLGLIGVLVLKLEKDKKALSNLPPLPPADSDLPQNSTQTSSTLEAGPFGRQVPDSPLPPVMQQKMPMPTPLPAPLPAPPTYREPIEAPELPPWIASDYQPYPASETPVATMPAPRSQPMAQTSGASWTTRSSTVPGASRKAIARHPVTQSLRNRAGARQAIIAMTVLGQPRALQPYEFDPIQQTDVAPGRPS